jgi:hypothetical protein
LLYFKLLNASGMVPIILKENFFHKFTAGKFVEITRLNCMASKPNDLAILSEC